MHAPLGGRPVVGRFRLVWAPARPCSSSGKLALALALVLALLGPSSVPPTASTAALPGAPDATFAGNRVDAVRPGQGAALSPGPSPNPGGGEFASALAAGATWYVDGQSGSDSNACTSAPAPCKTIGEAIRRSASGDTILVAPATYKEHLSIDGKALAIQGAGASSTILDGTGPAIGRMVAVGMATPAQLVLSGATVQWGYIGDTNGGKGAGIYVAPGSGLVLSDSVVTQNSNYWGQGGGGIGNDGSATLINVTVQRNSQGNRASNGSGSNGGGGIYNTGALTLTNTTVAGNSTNATSPYVYPGQARSPGGGIYSAGGTLSLTGVTVAANSGGQGGGIYIHGWRADGLQLDDSPEHR
jgi:hypothetical protein